MSTTSAAILQPVQHSLDRLVELFNSIPGSQVVLRYIQSSHRNDPGRTLLEVLLALFALWTFFQSRRKAGIAAKNFVKLSEEEIDDLVDEWQPEPLVTPLTPQEIHELSKVPVIQGAVGPRPKVLPYSHPTPSNPNIPTGNAAGAKQVLNLASFNFTGLAGNEMIKGRAIETLRKYGLGSCGPPGFYGTFDVHMELEKDLASFLGTESAIIYSQGFSTASSVIPAFCKRGDIIVADKGVNFIIQKGLQISRSTIRWYDHNDLQSLEKVLISVEKEMRKKGRSKRLYSRKFIVTEGIFENDGAMVDLPKLIELKNKYKFRLCLDESFSFGAVGRTGRGLTELYNVPASQIDMLVGSMANGLCAAGGFCAGSQVVVDHQRINGTSFVFSAALPALLAVSASEGIGILTSTPSVFEGLRENVNAFRSTFSQGIESVEILSHPASAIIHLALKRPVRGLTISSASSSRTLLAVPTETTKSKLQQAMEELQAEENLLQEVVDEALNNGVLITRAKRLTGQEGQFEVDHRPTIRIAATAALTKKETEKAASVVKNAFIKVLGKRR